MRAVLLLLLLACLLVAPMAEAREEGGWAQPALGASASGDPEILFTFDDGPDATNTPRIVDALNAHGVKAIFFVAGWRIRATTGKNALARRDTARKLLEAGQLFGNHTLDHVQLCDLTKEEAGHEIDENGRLLTEFTGMPVGFFRVPYGSRCRVVEELLSERGLHHLHWDLDAQEYWSQSTDETKEYLFDRLRRLKGRAVILLHDTKKTTARVLPEILEWIARENSQRLQTGERPIRILSYGDIVRERLAPGLLPLLDRGAQVARDLAPELARQLILPFAGESHPRAAALTR